MNDQNPENHVTDPDLIAACDIALDTGEIVYMIDQGICAIPDTLMTEYMAQGHPYVETKKITRRDGREVYFYAYPNGVPEGSVEHEQ